MTHGNSYTWHFHHASHVASQITVKPQENITKHINSRFKRSLHVHTAISKLSNFLHMLHASSLIPSPFLPPHGNQLMRMQCIQSIDVNDDGWDKNTNKNKNKIITLFGWISEKSWRWTANFTFISTTKCLLHKVDFQSNGKQSHFVRFSRAMHVQSLKNTHKKMYKNANSFESRKIHKHTFHVTFREITDFSSCSLYMNLVTRS